MFHLGYPATFHRQQEEVKRYKWDNLFNFKRVSLSSTAKRKYDNEFKENAVKLYERSDRSVRAVSENLGVPESTVSGWIEASREHGVEAFPGKGRLRTEDRELTQLQASLKKAAVARVFGVSRETLYHYLRIEI